MVILASESSESGIKRVILILLVKKSLESYIYSQGLHIKYVLIITRRDK